MATGLAYDIYSGKDESLEGFVWRCASQFFHDCSEVPALEDIERGLVSSEHLTNDISRAKAELDKLDSLTDVQIEDDERRFAEQSKRVYEDSLSRARLVRDRYMRVRAKVEAWDPPTKAHENLKLLCLRQIDSGIEHDCSEPSPASYCHEPRPVPVARQERRDRILDRIRFDEKAIEETQKRKREQIEFVRELEKSLPRPKR